MLLDFTLPRLHVDPLQATRMVVIRTRKTYLDGRVISQGDVSRVVRTHTLGETLRSGGPREVTPLEPDFCMPGEDELLEYRLSGVTDELFRIYSAMPTGRGRYKSYECRIRMNHREILASAYVDKSKSAYRFSIALTDYDLKCTDPTPLQIKPSHTGGLTAWERLLLDEDDF